MKPETDKVNQEASFHTKRNSTRQTEDQVLQGFDEMNETASIGIQNDEYYDTTEIDLTQTPIQSKMKKKKIKRVKTLLPGMKNEVL